MGEARAKRANIKGKEKRGRKQKSTALGQVNQGQDNRSARATGSTSGAYFLKRKLRRTRLLQEE